MHVDVRRWIRASARVGICSGRSDRAGLVPRGADQHLTHGRVRIVGVEGRDSIAVRARFYAGARDVSYAEAAFADAAAELSIENADGLWRIDYPGAAEEHGSAVASATGCTEMVIEVPTGSVAQPLVINGSTHAGGIWPRSSEWGRGRFCVRSDQVAESFFLSSSS